MERKIFRGLKNALRERDTKNKEMESTMLKAIAEKEQAEKEGQRFKKEAEDLQSDLQAQLAVMQSRNDGITDALKADIDAARRERDRMKELKEQEVEAKDKELHD